jgi:hypothetical protein
VIHALALTVLAVSSEPFCRSKVGMGTASDHCLYWAEKSSIVWQAEQTGNPETPGDDEVTAFRRAFGTWQAQMDFCGSLSFREGPRTASRNVGWVATPGAANENILLFRFKMCADTVPLSDSCWNDDDDADDCGNKFDCWQHASGAIAITTTTYDPQSGRVLDADIELNQPSFVFSTVDAPPCVRPNWSPSCVAWDVQNTVTHEIGHMLGLDHTTYPGSTMNPTAPPGELSKRVLDVGTRDFVCQVYARGQVAKDCVIVPYDGELGSTPGACACSSGAAALVPLALAALFRRRRRA